MIPVRNLYYMLAYAFRVLEKDEFWKLGAEEFENIHDLLSEILMIGLRSQLRRGPRRTYDETTEELATVRGKIELSETIKAGSLMRNRIVCSFDEFTTDDIRNRIIKKTLFRLLSADIPVKRKKCIRSVLGYFSEVSDIDLNRVDWNIRFERSDSIYRMLIYICRLLYEGLLMNEYGEKKLVGFKDDREVCALYEKFILEYFKKEHPELDTSASFIAWDIDEEDKGKLPLMKSDVMLRYKGNTLIIDAKYHETILNEHFDKKTWTSSNLYQIFTYVKNEEMSPLNKGDVSGMLLYAATEEEIEPETHTICGSRITMDVLDLNKDFSEIRGKLDKIAEEFETQAP